MLEELERRRIAALDRLNGRPPQTSRPLAPSSPIPADVVSVEEGVVQASEEGTLDWFIDQARTYRLTTLFGAPVEYILWQGDPPLQYRYYFEELLAYGITLRVN